MADYDKCPFCDGSVKTYVLPPIHKDDCIDRESTSCGCPYDSVMECDNCSKIVDIGDYEIDNDVESRIELFIEHTARPWK